ASVGETNAAQPLIEAILDRTEEALVISNFTVTGYERSAELFANRVVQTYLPFDLPWCVNTFLRRSQPKAILIIETELWPNLLFACRKKNIPVYILSARLSDNSFSRYVKIKSLFKPAIQAVRKIGAQSELDQARFKQLGFSAAQMCLTGNIKYDLKLPTPLPDTIKHLVASRRVIVAASTRDNEEELILRMYQQLMKTFENLLLIIVPRHPQRFIVVQQLIKKYKFIMIRRSETIDCVPDQVQVMLGDSLGEMIAYLNAAEVVCMGGTFENFGGQNPLEPSALGHAIIAGHSVYNFKEVFKHLQQAKASTTVSNESDLINAVTMRLNDQALNRRMGDAAAKMVEENRGALKNTLAIISDTLL
ncbi:MAG: 3-deoxy-D-manno-octulosonic acid transferase, partial [Gammaproteobacteria bacterium]|nr:3-deoxy-D-manno-octulosonic acid transferase [Gammaproteobacteria bacterium]